MMEAIKNALETHKGTVIAATNTFQAVKHDTNLNYKGKLFTEKMKTAKQAFDDACKQSREKTEMICQDVLNGIREKANAVIIQDTPADFPATLEVLKAMQQPTKTEVEAIIGKYKSNYLAYRAICDVVGGAVAGYDPITIDDIIESLAALETMLHRVIYGSIDDYMFRLVTEGNYLDRYDDFYTSFLEGRFSEAGEAVQEHDEDN